MLKTTRVYTRKISRLSVVATAVLILFCMCTVFLFAGCSKNTAYYSEMSNHGWISLRYYECNAGKHLGRSPDNFLDEVFEVNAVSPNKLLYIEHHSLWGETIPELLWNSALDEPIRTLPINKITIDTGTNTPTIINDDQTLQKLSELLKTDGISFENHYGLETNTVIDLVEESELVWMCNISQRADGAVILTCYNQEAEKYQYYDVTDIFGKIQ